MPVQGSDGGGVGQGLTCLRPAPARANGPQVHTISTGEGRAGLIAKSRPSGLQHELGGSGWSPVGAAVSGYGSS